MQHFVFSAAFFLDAVRVAIQDLENRQRTFVLGKLPRHVISGSQRHHGVEADVVLAAKGSHIGQSRRRYQLLQIRSFLPSLGQERQQLADRGLLKRLNQRLQFSKS